MKYELTDSRKRYSDIELLNDLRAVANNLGKNSLKMRDYSKNNGAKFKVDTLTKRFGNWDVTLKSAGLEGEKSLKGMEYGEKSIKDEVLIADLLRVANELNNPKITIAEYNRFGKYTVTTMSDRFGSWNKAKQRANLEITAVTNTTTEEFHQNILELWTLLGRQPKYGEVISPNSKYHGCTYARKFGSWRAALEKFIEYINSDSNDDEVIDDTPSLIPINNATGNIKEAQKKPKIKRTPRGINLRLRWIVLDRDNFSCKNCGRSPATDLRTILHVDHIIPWSKGGETILENLQSLCEQCNLGKGNLMDALNNLNPTINS